MREDDDEGEETEEDTHGAFEQIVSAEGVEQEEDLELDWFGSHAVSNVLALDRDETRLRPSNEEDEQSSFTITDVSPGSYTMEKSGFGAKVRRIPSELDLVLLRYPTAVPYEYLVQNKFLYSLLAGHDFMVNRS